MTNKDVLNRKHPEEIEQMLAYLLMGYWEQLKNKLNLKDYGSSPINIVKVYKDFLKEETYIDTDLYDRMYPKKEEDIIDVEFVEIKED